MEGYICPKGVLLEALFSNHRETDQKIQNHVLLAISPESSARTRVCVYVCVCVCARVRVCVCVCVVSGESDIYILMLYISKNFNGNLYFRQGTHYIKRRYNVLSAKKLLVK